MISFAQNNQFTFGFSNIDSIFYSDNLYSYINLHFLIKNYGKNKDELIKNLKELIFKFVPNAKFITSGSPLNQQLQQSRGLNYLSQSEIDLMKMIFCEAHILTFNLVKIDWVPEDAIPVNISENGLYVRYGNVELRVIENFFRNRDKSINSIANILPNLNDKDFIFKKMNPDEYKWLSSQDFDFNLKALMTNAGFYFSENFEEAKNDLSYWAHKYLEGLKLGKLFLYPGAYPFFWNIWNFLENNNEQYVQYASFPDPQNFFKMLKGKKVLVVTPFKELLDRMISESRLKNLYKNFIIDDIDFTFLQSPMSIYPHRPDLSWSASYNNLLNSASDFFINKNADIFLASCGCYGIPLTTDIYKKFNCPSVYYGNWLNTLLGIKQACSINFGNDGLINDQLRLESDLGKYENLNLIDGGRYI